MKAIIVSLKFHPGHVSHLVASYKQCEELGYTSYYYVCNEFIDYLPQNSRILIWSKDKPSGIDVAVFTFPNPHNIAEMLKLRLSGKTHIVYIFHEPLTKLAVYKKSGFSTLQLIKLAVGDWIEAVTVKMADSIILPSKRALNYYKENKLYRNYHYYYIPLMFNDEREQRHEMMPRLYFGYIGTVAVDHSFKEFLQFVEWAIKNNRLPEVRFLIATKSSFEVPDVLKKSKLVIIQQGRPLTNEEINTYYASTYCVWNAYTRTTQSGVLAKSFMFGTPALILKKNCNEFAHDGIEIKAIEDNTKKEEIESAVEHIIKDFYMYSENCREQFLESFYYRKYNDDFKALVR